MLVPMGGDNPTPRAGGATAGGTHSPVVELGIEPQASDSADGPHLKLCVKPVVGAPPVPALLPSASPFRKQGLGLRCTDSGWGDRPAQPVMTVLRSLAR